MNIGIACHLYALVLGAVFDDSFNTLCSGFACVYIDQGGFVMSGFVYVIWNILLVSYGHMGLATYKT